MVFSAPIFLVIFLPAVLLFYYLLPLGISFFIFQAMNKYPQDPGN